MKLLAIFVFVLFSVDRATANEPPLQVTDLSCEYLSNPLGIDVRQPRLSWKLHGTRRGVLQLAYQILVSSSPERLAAEEGDLWDSGKITSGQSIQVPYAGRALRSHQRCFWKVRVWNQHQDVSPWSEVATWSMGILSQQEWGAKWLSHSKPLKQDLPISDPAAPLTLEDESWLHSPEANKAPPGGSLFFRRIVDLPTGVHVNWAYLQLASTGSFQLFVNGDETSVSAEHSEPWRRAYDIELSERLRPGPNLLAVRATAVSEDPVVIAARLVVQLSDGEQLILKSENGWRTSQHGKTNWNKKDFDDSHWPVARTHSPVGSGPWGVPARCSRVGWSQRASSPLLRKAFRIEQPVLSATVTICGLGYHELRLNGQKVGDHVLDPAFTRYDRRSLYVTHDVTDQIRDGDNAIGVMLGNGWYNMHTRATWNFDRAPWRSPPKMALHLRIKYADGTLQTIVSDESWRANTGPVVLDGIRAGEVYDARQERPGWDTPEFDDADWDVPAVVEAPTDQLSAQMMPPMRVTQTVRPIGISEPRPGVFVFDLGQHMAGWVRLRVRGPAGKKVTLRYSESVDATGMIERSKAYMYVFEGPFQTDQYILRGQGDESWEPRFSYHGFRYVAVTGFPGRPALDSITGCVVHTDFESAGNFECSNELLNKIQKATLGSYRGNFHGYPTDCPAREKNGWTGDAHLAAEQAMFNFRNASAYQKWIQDIGDEQTPEGVIPAMVPTGGWGYAWGNGPAWDSAFLHIPWYMYLYEGDARILEQQYDRMKKYVDYLTSRSDNYIVSFGLGDWASAKTETPVPITSTGYYYVDTWIVAQAARVLDKQEDAKAYAELAEKIREAFNKEFHRGNGVYLNGSQTALSCAVFQKLVDPKDASLVAQRLAEKVGQADDHLDVGILGAKYLFHALSENGHHELAYRIATQTTHPSYGYWMERGATTLWESWPGDKSLNHIMFGDISAWFYQKLAGINPVVESPGFKHFVIRPQPAGDLTWVDATTESMYGTIRSKWRLDEDGRFQLDVAVPANTTATICLPNSDVDNVTESGNPIVESSDFQVLGTEDGFAMFTVGSGTYQFTANP